MKKILAVIVFLNLLMFGCGFGESPANNAGNTANTATVNVVNSVIENVQVVNDAANRISSPESHTPTFGNSVNQTRSNTNVNSVKNKVKTESVVENTNKKADQIINNQNGAVKKIKKNAEKLLKDLP